MNVPSAKGRRRRSPSSRSTPVRASFEKNGLMSIPIDAAPRSRFHNRARPLPHPRSITRSSGERRRNDRSMSLRIFDPSSGGDTRSCRASAWSASSRYFVCSANCSAGRRSRYSPALRYSRPHATQASTPAASSRRDSGMRHSGHRTRFSSRPEIMPCDRRPKGTGPDSGRR